MENWPIYLKNLTLDPRRCYRSYLSNLKKKKNITTVSLGMYVYATNGEMLGFSQRYKYCSQWYLDHEGLLDNLPKIVKHFVTYMGGLRK